MVTAKQFIEKVLIPLVEHWGYIYGTWGSVWTAKKQAASTREMTVKYGSKWIGRMVTDCSGLIRWALWQFGVFIVHHARYQYTDHCSAKGKLINGQRDDGEPIKPGTAVFLQGKESKIHHVGVYIGSDIVVEAKGTNYGVVVSRLNHWDHWGELKAVDYTDALSLEGAFQIPNMSNATVSTAEDAEAGTIMRAIVTNPQKWLNVRSSANSGATRLFQVQNGATVEVLDAGEPEWWQIRYGKQIGWAWAEYLTLVPADHQSDDDTSDDEKSEEPSRPVPSVSDDELTVKLKDLQTALDIAQAAVDKLGLRIEDLSNRIEEILEAQKNKASS